MGSEVNGTRRVFTKEQAKALGADCDHCPLRATGRPVGSVIPDGATVGFVGEAPGANEAREGTPFIGPSGRLLGLVARNAGIDKDKEFLSNATLCRPPDGGTPPKMAIAACRPRLLTELETAGVDTVVALGNSAALAVLGVEGVTKLRVGRGRTSPYPQLAGRRILATLHPAACLRQSDMFPSLVKDVQKVVGGPSDDWHPPEYRVVDDPLEAIEALREVEARGGDLVVDIEVDIDKESANDHADRYDLLCVGLYDGSRALVVGENALRDGNVVSALGDALRACNLINQNIMFDLAGLFPHVGALEGVGDTMLASYVLDERPGVHDLEQQAVEILNAPTWKHEIERYVKGATTEELEHYHGYGRIPRDILYRYNAYDLKNTWDLWKYYEVALEKLGKPHDWPDSIPYEYKSLRELHDFLVWVSNELKYLELNGIYVDWNYNLQLLNTYEEDLEKLRKEINDLLVADNWEPINPNSPQQVKRLLTEHWNLRIPNTNEETISTLMDQLYSRYGDGAYENVIYQFCDLLLRHRKDAKMYGTYVKGIRKRRYKGKIHANYRIHGTVTGRLASRNPNMQNIPRMKKIKRQFVPRPAAHAPLAHNVFVQGDYKSAELRSLSWLAQDSYFREVLSDPERDLFDELTPQLRPDLPPKDEFLEHLGQDAWGDLRVRIKAFVYGLGYGRTAVSIAREYKMPKDEAFEMTARFFEVIPEIVEWQKWVKQRVKNGHDLINPFGRHRRFHLITEENWKSVQNEALAFLPQSTSADITLTAFARLRQDVRGTGVILRNTVHDSILGDVPPDDEKIAWFSKQLEQRMIEAAYDVVGDYIPYTVDVKVGKSWDEV